MLSPVAGAVQAEPAVPASPAGAIASAVPAKTLTLTVEVVGGKPNLPISGAWIFVRTEAGALLVESRTNKQGLSVIQDVPAAKVKFQVAATTDWAPQGVVIDVGSLKAPTLKFVLVANTASEPAR